MLMYRSKNGHLRLADRPADYKSLGISPVDIAEFEDGHRIGTNRFVGDLKRYHITATIEEISVDIELTGDVPAWRPKSGHSYFGVEGREKLFAWLPAVPHGLANVRYSIGKEEYRASGSGYHDHNWGDVPMQTLMHNWYWARASVGPYTVIASYITATAAYGYEKRRS